MTPFGKVMREHLLTRYAPKEQLYAGGFGAQGGANSRDIKSAGDIVTPQPDAPPTIETPKPPGTTSPIIDATQDLTPNPYAGMTSNQAFDASMAAAHEDQARYLDTTQADTIGRVQSGALVPGTPEYASSLDYLAGLKGGVATKDAELARLAGLGLTSSGYKPPAPTPAPTPVAPDPYAGLSSNDAFAESMRQAHEAQANYVYPGAQPPEAGVGQPAAPPPVEPVLTPRPEPIAPAYDWQAEYARQMAQRNRGNQFRTNEL